MTPGTGDGVPGSVVEVVDVVDVVEVVEVVVAPGSGPGSVSGGDTAVGAWAVGVWSVGAAVGVDEEKVVTAAAGTAAAPAGASARAKAARGDPSSRFLPDLISTAQPPRSRFPAAPVDSCPHVPA
ncbi:MAG TPA: hypothetical protein VGR90_09340 [Acidimicrobiales bacterium]|nr:hypothetical protein [Acidimicrobiales bacterium]